MLVEALQGLDLLASLTVAHLGGQELAIQAARNFRRLRSRGVSVRKTIDTIIATWRIERGRELLHDGRDFEPFAAHPGLRVAARAK